MPHVVRIRHASRFVEVRIRRSGVPRLSGRKDTSRVERQGQIGRVTAAVKAQGTGRHQLKTTGGGYHAKLDLGYWRWWATHIRCWWRGTTPCDRRRRTAPFWNRWRGAAWRCPAVADRLTSLLLQAVRLRTPAAAHIETNGSRRNPAGSFFTATFPFDERIVPPASEQVTPASPAA